MFVPDPGEEIGEAIDGTGCGTGPCIHRDGLSLLVRGRRLGALNFGHLRSLDLGLARAAANSLYLGHPICSDWHVSPAVYGSIRLANGTRVETPGSNCEDRDRHRNTGAEVRKGQVGWGWGGVG